MDPNNYSPDEFDELFARQLASLDAPAGYEERVMAGTRQRVRRIKRRRNVITGVTTMTVTSVVAASAMALPGLLRDDPVAPASSSPIVATTDDSLRSVPISPTPTERTAPTSIPSSLPTTPSVTSSTDLEPTTAPAKTTDKPESPTQDTSPTGKGSPDDLGSLSLRELNALDTGVASTDVPLDARLLLPGSASLPKGMTYWTNPELDPDNPVASEPTDAPHNVVPYDKPVVVSGLACNDFARPTGTNPVSGIATSVYGDNTSGGLSFNVTDYAPGQTDEVLSELDTNTGRCRWAVPKVVSWSGADQVTMRSYVTLDGTGAASVIVRGDRVIAVSYSPSADDFVADEADAVMTQKYARAILEAQIAAEQKASG